MDNSEKITLGDKDMEDKRGKRGSGGYGQTQKNLQEVTTRACRTGPEAKNMHSWSPPEPWGP